MRARHYVLNYVYITYLLMQSVSYFLYEYTRSGNVSVDLS